jgi:acyl-CoA oxidase
MAGDLGTKFGYAAVDNCWIIFNQVRIPRENMLCRLAGVDREGNFEIKGDLRALY